ncbi:unnamed protein product [Rotaria socialis]|uniref:Uncharacterized protein n=1 Tax=Rotaria socialis TaxID=392032 RepID=A0A820TP94_9BILA|nr:unnamed protein product [Rotaria socialis]
MNNFTFNNTDWFDDIFDIVIIDDDNDDDKKEVERMILEDYYEDFDIHFKPDADDDDEENFEVNENVREEEEEVLSQKLIELSTEGQKRPVTTPTSSQEENSRKKRICLSKVVDIKQPSNQITSYLETMDEMFHHTMVNSMIPRSDLQAIIEYKHQMKVIQLNLQRWTRYYEVGVEEQLWSIEVKEKLSIKTSDEKQYAIYIQQYLDELDQQFEHLQQQLNSDKKDLVPFTDHIEHQLDEFIQNYRLVPYTMKSDYQLARFDYEYQDQLLERQFLQIEFTKNLYKFYYEYQTAKKELVELKHRIQCNYPTQQSVTQALSMLSRTISTTVVNPNFYHQEIDQDEKKLQDYLNNFMMKSIQEAEKKISQCRLLFQKQEQLSQSILTSSLIDGLYRRYELCKRKLDCTEQFRLNYYLRQHFGQQSDEFNLAKVSFSPTVIVHASMHVFNKEHLRLLSRGPTYVPPYQMTKKQNLEKNYKQLQHDLNLLFVKSNVNMVQSMFLQKKIKDLYMEMFSTIIPSKSMYERAHYEQQLIEQIQNDLKRFNLILRRTHDQQNVFYLGDRKSFEIVSNQFMLETDLFEIDMTIDKENVQATRDYLTNKIKLMNCEFENIFVNTTKYKDELKKINVVIDKVELPYLYFLPDLSKQPLLNVKPMMMTTQYNATYRLGKFLNQLLQPVIDIYQQGRIFHNGTDFLEKFHNYIDQYDRLRSTTNFVTITINNFYHLVPHHVPLSTLLDFFVKYYHLPIVENIHITKIVRLTSLFLHNNRFYYDGKIYRFLKGGPSNSGLIETLSNIYLNRMDNFLIDQSSTKQNEFYGRYQNQIFLTWNQSLDELEQILKSMKSEYHHLSFDIHIGKNLNYLDLYLENRHSLLYSRVHRQPNQQPYTLPYISSKGDSIRKHSHWLRSSLIRIFNKKLREILSQNIQLENTTFENNKLQFIITTKHQYSLNSLLSEQRPTHPILN